MGYTDESHLLFLLATCGTWRPDIALTTPLRCYKVTTASPTLGKTRVFHLEKSECQISGLCSIHKRLIMTTKAGIVLE